MTVSNREIYFLNFLLFLVGICDTTTLSLPNIFYSAGTSKGDIIAGANDDGSTGSINLNLQFPFFGASHSSLYVNTTTIYIFDNKPKRIVNRSTEV